jgi:RNA polymerase sigma factor (sigma-70 family)
METAAHFSPFSEDCRDADVRTGPGIGPDDATLVAEAVSGSRDALERLVGRHARWIYNIAFRMVMTPQDAEDVTQEVLVKVLTKLSSFDPSRAAFRTWLYRIVANHVINMRSRGYEAAVTSLDEYYAGLAQVPDQDETTSPEAELLAADLGISCVMGTLLCLERSQRLVLILAVGLGATDTIGSEILGISRDAFRKSLSRARAKLHRYMSGSCGLLNPEAECRCRRKVPSLLAAGAISAERIIYHHPSAPRVSEVLGEEIARMDSEIHSDLVGLFRAHPFYPAPESLADLGKLLERGDFGTTLRSTQDR